MVLLETEPCDFGKAAGSFDLLGVDGEQWTLERVAGRLGTVVMFISNHCPYVQAVLDRLIADVATLEEYEVKAVAIMSNDTVNYPEDSYDNMQKLAQEKKFPFPYLFDETQQVARAYGAVCTPDFFGFDHALRLQYRGRLDDLGKNTAPASAKRKQELVLAMTEIAKAGKSSARQIPSMGCSIKWKP